MTVSVHTPLLGSNARKGSRSKAIVLAAVGMCAAVALITLAARPAAEPYALVGLGVNHPMVGLPVHNSVNEQVLQVHDQALSAMVGLPVQNSVNEEVLQVHDQALSAPAKATQLVLDQKMKDDLLAQHNAVRCMHGAPPMTWDDGVATFAQLWADKLKADSPDKCQMKHSTSNSAFRQNAGENLAWGSLSNYFESGGRTMKKVVTMWYDEVEYYDFNQPGTTINLNKAIGHFTQVVWDTSLKLGCGVASCTNGQVVVCQYSPPGNYIGQYGAHVAGVSKTATVCNVDGAVKQPCAADNTCAAKSTPSAPPPAGSA
eukprot:CAMPEP_0206229044 /NCGR_PEP_ID=MMETSP0047_2-20121206/9485_1 /ASSEMBLY_ACC=CAM_ASM_000192 /TAXON_ID=195065 /ORGANISM="Chroomonas mesostigmatica_cf, Strain CCMP1168" /LENGTH=314 /DNA_ID=CAMNT_0053652313 /DNA_START=37 /DNA_END=978 /DNA_ORIENTATION=+